MSVQKEYKRFDVAQRLEHWLMVISFIVLAVTGIPQKFAGDGWAEAMISLMNGIETVRTLHHISAIVLLLECIYHVVVVAYKVIVLRVRWTMFPQLQDVGDALNAIKHNLGVLKEPPRYGRYSFGEKFEYWALVWGTLIMAITGFMLWNPIITSRFFTGDLIPAAKAAHGAEAILAVLAVLTWHIYHVHIKTFNKSMFTGRLSAHEMEAEHAEELARIERDNGDAVITVPSAATIKARRAVFLPVSLICSLLLLLGVYLFISAETTAVTTVPPPPSRQQVFVPRPPTAIPTRPPTPAATPAPGATPGATPVQVTPGPTTPSLPVAVKPLPASHAGKTVCQACHATGIGNAPKNPPDHAGRLDASCRDCHKGS